MIEKLQSAGVSTYENDQSFIQPGISQAGISIIGPTEKGAAYIPTDVTSYQDFVSKFGSDGSDTYVPQTVLTYLQAGQSAKVTRILGNGGWTYGPAKRLAAIVSGSTIITVLHPSKNDNANAASLNSSLITGSFANFTLSLSGSNITLKTISGSLGSTDPKYLLNVIGTDENFQTASAFPYLHFNNYYTGSIVAASSASLTTSSAACTFTSSFGEGYDNAKTPWILSSGGQRLFRLHHRSHGLKTNRDIKISISDITTNTNPTVFTKFSIIVRAWNDTDTTPSIIEQFTNVTLDPNASNYVGRVIGDKYAYYDSTVATIVENGNYANASKYIRIELADAVDLGSITPSVTLGGFEAYFETVAGFGNFRLPSASYATSNTSSNVYSGFNFLNTDNLNYLNPVPSEAVTGSNANFTIPTNDNKFTLALQGGTDGMNFAQIRKIGASIATDGTNVFGYDLSTSATAGTAAYSKALTILSNAQDFRYELLVIPGVINQYHSAVTTLAQNMVETRTDCFYIMDLVGLASSVQTAVNQTAGLDSNYVGVYHPWVRVRDINSNRIISVPPSVVAGQAFAYNDRVAAPWYAPAGIARGGLGGVVDVYAKVTKADMNSLYQARINPVIRNTAGGGVVLYGQKTLQVKASALDRINVRRLLIRLRGVIGNMANALVFDQNTNATRNSFLAKVNPYLESVQQKQGLYAAKCVMDESNNTSDVIDRNELRGTIYLWPTKSIEFIILEFNIQPTGVSFS